MKTPDSMRTPKKAATKQRVSQSTINDIKKMGMTAALKAAGGSKSAEYKEGVLRMYGAKRFAAATAPKASAKPTPTDSRFKGLGAGKAKPIDSRFTGLGAGKAKNAPTDSRFTGMGSKPAASKPAAKVATQKAKPRFGGFSIAAAGISSVAANTPKAKRDRKNALAAKKK